MLIKPYGFRSSCSLGDHFGGLGSTSVTILLLSGNVLDVSASSSSFLGSSDGFKRPVISSLLGMNTSAGNSVSLLLLMEVRSSGESTNVVRMIVLLS